MPEIRLKIAVFIDFDNIEIGVKNTLNAQFDIGVVLEALKERGDVVSKTAYGDWTRAGDYSRSLTQHATKLVQRNLTPGGDKNGADINLALDALEMAFTHTHISGYVIVGGDSDFISLVEKLKQYDKQIFVVGGRSFTSQVMQRNCHEFIAYENLIGGRGRDNRGSRGPSGPAAAPAPVEQVMPLMRRALKMLTDREVTPQLGLLKSTLLQLDSTFSERTYGAGSFRDFAQKLASAGHVVLRESGRNVLVELAENSNGSDEGRVTAPPPSAPSPAPRRHEEREVPSDAAPSNGGRTEPRTADGIREVRRLFQAAQNPPRWPMYIRQAKQFLRNVDTSFDERKYGFASLVDLMRACQRDGLFRIERDRQGVMRLFPGNVMQAADSAIDDNRGNVAEPVDAATNGADWSEPEPPSESEVVDGYVVQEMNAAASVVAVEDAGPEPGNDAPPVTEAAPRRRGGRRPKGAATTDEGSADGAQSGERHGARKEAKAPKARKTASKPRAARPRPQKEPVAS